MRSVAAVVAQVRLPEAYVVARASKADGGLWVGALLRICARMVGDASSIEIIDEEQENGAGDMAGAVLKLCEPLPAEVFLQLSQELPGRSPEGLKARLLEGASPAMSLAPRDLLIEYFRREFAVNSRMILHTDCCVRLTHVSTGRSARSTAHRSRVLNYEEALLLLESVVRQGEEP